MNDDISILDLLTEQNTFTILCHFKSILYKDEISYISNHILNHKYDHRVLSHNCIYFFKNASFIKVKNGIILDLHPNGNVEFHDYDNLKFDTISNMVRQHKLSLIANM